MFIYLDMTTTPSQITLESTIKRNSDGLLASEVGDEMVMMDIEAGNYISLNKIGRIIWEQIEQPLPVSTLINNLVNRFNVEEDECVKDTLDYLNNMLQQKVITTI